MVFYIIACNEDGKTEEDIKRKICDQVLKDKGRDIGTVHHMTNEKVSFNYLNLFILILNHRS